VTEKSNNKPQLLIDVGYRLRASTKEILRWRLKSILHKCIARFVSDSWASYLYNRFHFLVNAF